MNIRIYRSSTCFPYFPYTYIYTHTYMNNKWINKRIKWIDGIDGCVIVVHLTPYTTSVLLVDRQEQEQSTIIINLCIRTRSLYASFSFTRIRIPSLLMTQLPSERFIRSDSSLRMVMADGVMVVRSPMKGSKIRQLYIIGYLEPNSRVLIHSFV